ncbi:MAG: malonic semialdehyde reductase [Bdellovibrio sp.]
MTHPTSPQNSALSSEALSLLFTGARSHHAWTKREVDDSLLRSIYETGKWAPTSANTNPGRIVFLKSKAAKERIYPALMGSNVAQVEGAPVTAIVAQDLRFFDHLPKLFPQWPDGKASFEADSSLAVTTAFRNSSLQGAYFVLAARALGLDVCPMSGFDPKKVDEEFFGGTSWKSNFIFTLGYGDFEKLSPRNPRLTFEESARIL